ncbi:hypothetical protein [Tsuneonella mangrovi]|uniref:hypothetical protein n=1 Tax=Tsuneonella mangrovi TaxID=1982042 RepID=UPI000BA291E3|nr:hypothetical protein [Tsuneonella mangrovi]
MTRERIEAATQRIETALARIAKASDEARPATPSVSALVVKHEELRETVANTLKDLDALLAEIDR